MADLRNFHPNDLAKVIPPLGVSEKTWSFDQRRELIARYLDVMKEDEPLNESFLQSLNHPLFIQALISFVTQDPTPLDLENDFQDPKYASPHIFSPLRPEIEESIFKRSYFVMKIISFASSTSALEDILRQQCAHVIAPIFRAFRCQHSTASIFHLCKVLDTIVSLNSSGVLN